MIILKSPQEINRMRVASKIVADILNELRTMIQPGITTYELDKFASNEAKKRNSKCAFLGYHNYPSSLCCSLNDQVVHGIPTKTPLVQGDIISLDFGIYFDDFFGDAAATFPVGEISKSADALLKVTEQSLQAGISMAYPGNRLGDVSFAVQSYVEDKGYSVVRDFVGHGIGRNLHEDPQVPNYGQSGKGVVLKPGMVLAIEPMINEKSHEVKVLKDKWTVVTCDGGLSAHFEHTVAITDKGPEILTLV
ncbi:MAG TPA: type I methionyl aminopeptidase [Desulfuromonadales bacterium]|nr:type I methionyl aminopeptidase [Desulfuromonadales bacterium]